MDIKGIESLLHVIEDGITGPKDASSTVDAIDEFQQDPLALDKSLPKFITSLTSEFLKSNEAQKNRTARVFYTFSKVCTVKKVMKYLETDIFLLPGFLDILRKTPNSLDWHLSYMCLAWLSMLSMAPFKLGNDTEVYEVTSRFKSSQVLHPLVSSLHSQLFLKNRALFELDLEKNGFDLHTLNFTLKLLVYKKQDDIAPFIDDKLLNEMAAFCQEEFKTANEGQGSLILKILPKICNLYALREEWEPIENIVSWFLDNLNLSSTNLRFKLARNFAKIVLLINQFSDNMAQELVEMSVSEAIRTIEDNTMESIDADVMHVFLLMIAEFARCNLLPQGLINSITEQVVPYTIRFQQMRISKIQGHQVRDATNFICWSMIRNSEVEGSVEVMFLNLLMCSMFDHELLIRKSSNAALQELLGRYGHYIMDDSTIVRIIELPISNLQNSFFQNVPILLNLFGNKYLHFSKFMLKWLITNSVFGNNDLSIVKIASRALAKLLKDNPKSRFIHDGLLGEINTILQMKETTGSLKYCKLIYLATETYLIDDDKNLKSACFREFSALINNISGNMSGQIESFQSICFMKLLNFMLTSNGQQFRISEGINETLFRVIRYQSTNNAHYNEVKSLFLPIVPLLGDSAVFEDGVNKHYEVTFHKFLKFNNPICCAALAYTSPSKFVDALQKWCPQLNSEARSQLLDSLTNRLRGLVDECGTTILKAILEFLDDYTITNQGDVGRMVRTSAARLIDRNINLFTESGIELLDIMSSKLMRLAGEPSDNLKRLSFSILCRLYDYAVQKDCEFNKMILDFQQTQFEGKNSGFWEGYLTSAGAVYSTDQQITSSIDCFLWYYEELTPNSKRDLINDLVRIIPNAKMLQSWQSSKSHLNVLGCQQKDMIKQALTYLTFWRRILESNIKLSPSFNFNGFYAKVYNIHLVRNHPTLKTISIELLALITLKSVSTVESPNDSLLNDLIKRLWKLAKGSSEKKDGITALQRISLNALATVFLETHQVEKAILLAKHSRDQDSLNELNVHDII